MNELFGAFLIGCGFGMPVGVVIYNIMNKLNDQHWEDKIKSCANCKWSYELDSFLICSARSEDNLCEKWEEVQE